jgi:hypothetical protein
MNRTLAAALAAGLIASPAALAAPREAAGPARYNGPWTVQMVKESGLCDSSFRYAIVIRDGDIAYRPDPGDKPLAFSGQVGTGGDVRIAASRGPAQVAATGRLQGASGSGTWSLPLLGCQGRWTARRTGTEQASNE